MARSLATAPVSRRGTRRPSGTRTFGLPTLPVLQARPLRVLPGAIRAMLGLVGAHSRLRNALLAGLLALPLLSGAWMWFRDSSFVAVQRVQISGVHGPDAAAVEAALTAAARRMSTLDVSTGALHAAVAPLRLVAHVRAIPSFPHSLRIEVTEQLPVAVLNVSGVRTAVAADGVVLGPAFVSGELPSIDASPSGEQSVIGERVNGAQLRAGLSVLGAAPAPLLSLVERVFTGAKGLTAAMRNGLLVYFGDASRPHAKWLSLARVLADPSSAGASYVDVRVPGRPAAGFPAGVNPPDASASASSSESGEASVTRAQPSATGTESTVAALAQSLSSGSGVAAPTATPTGAGGSASTSAGASGGEASAAVAPAGTGDAGGASPQSPAHESSSPAVAAPTGTGPSSALQQAGAAEAPAAQATTEG